MRDLLSSISYLARTLAVMSESEALRVNDEENENEAENVTAICNWGEKKRPAPLTQRADGTGTKRGKRKCVSTSCYF